MNEPSRPAPPPGEPPGSTRKRIGSWLPPEARRLAWTGCKAVSDFVVRHRARGSFQRRLQEGRPLWLELGAGRVKGRNGWTTIDEVKGADVQFGLNGPFPLPDGCVEKIYSSHVLEHFFEKDLMRLLRECCRVLKPGGLFLVCVPDARIFIDAYHRPESLRERGPVPMPASFQAQTPIDYLNYIAYMLDNTHRHLFDEAHLLAILREAGFREARLRDFDPALDLEAHRLESIHAVAIK